MPVPPSVQGNGVCTDEQAGTVVMLRGDMDALPVVEESGEPFASTNGCMHACGHDMHATALLGAARLLKAREAALVDANATVKLLFQPGEETFEGARAAIADGLLENPRPQAAFRFPATDLGKVTGTITSLEMVGGTVGAIVSGVLFDATGSFASTWIVCLVCSVVMLVFLLASEPIAAKLRASVAGE